MKHSKLTKALALVLTLSLCLSLTTPALAAGRGSSSSTGSKSAWSWSWNWNDLWDRLFGGAKEEEEETPAETETGSDVTMTLVEDETTVEEGTVLRASTYALTSGASTYATDETTLKYFPVTLYNYDGRMNSATHQAEVDAALAAGGISNLPSAWQGIYFGCANVTDGFYYYTGNSSDTAYVKVDITFDEDGNPQIENGEYLIVNAATQEALTNSQKSGNYRNHLSGSTTYSSTYLWTISASGSGYTVKYKSGNYLNIASGSASTGSTSQVISIAKCNDGISLSRNSAYLNKFGGSTDPNQGYAGWYDATAATDTNSTFYLYRAMTGYSNISARGYEAWNKFTNGYITYSGLVSSSLDANKDIQFNKPDGGIFSSDATVKDVYTNVGLPFVYDSATKYYTFDAGAFGAYFQGAPASNTDLYYDTVPQGHNVSTADNRNVGWFPFNDTSETTATTEGSVSRKVVSTPDYYFGMNATIPFTMTANGKMNPNDPASEDIVFSFSGDDDVWVFIDGILVLDMGGCRNCMDAEINFAENTWTITGYGNKIGSDVNGNSLSGTIFNEGETMGTLNQTRETFAATDTHELTIFYLERGAGSSNCKIQFNLPMKDVVSVTKRATQSIDQDGNVTPLTAKEQAAVDNIDFGFTLTKNGAPVANTNYNLLNANGQVISTPSTDANGHFTLRNGQTAKFVGEIAADGAEYQVVEDIPNNTVKDDEDNIVYTFSKAIYTYNGTAAGGYTVNEAPYSNGNEIPSTPVDITYGVSIASDAVTAKGSTEAEDSLQFICENYFNASLPNPSSRPVDDQIVLDYGLSVIIDPLANDVYRGDTIELTGVTGAQYGTATIENGKITYQLNKQLSGVEVLTYTAKVTGTDNEGEAASESRTAQVYIIPATSMYYEENFSGLVTFSDGWSDVGTAQTDPQEPGVVGTVGDSPYGSDAAYLNDSGDSNGSSKYVNTTNGSASFSYTFTGTGTSFFARTSSTAAYMRVVVTDSEGETVSDIRRNNIYKSVDGTDMGTLYNIPVYTTDGLEYGTYTVTVTVMKAMAEISRGKDFYLDGIRVINPLNEADTNASVAKAAYAADGEANMTVVTLRQKLLGEAAINDDGTLSWDGTNFVVFTDTNGAITAAEEYRSNGPKEEVYLNNGQSVTFSLYNWDPNTNRLYLGIKAPTGSGSVSINGNTLTLSNAADCYYDISGYADITTDKDSVKTATFTITSTVGLVSVTNIKVTGNAEFTIIEEKNEDVIGDNNEGGNGDVNDSGASE